MCFFDTSLHEVSSISLSSIKSNYANYVGRILPKLFAVHQTPFATKSIEFCKFGKKVGQKNRLHLLIKSTLVKNEQNIMRMILEHDYGYLILLVPQANCLIFDLAQLNFRGHKFAVSYDGNT